MSSIKTPATAPGANPCPYCCELPIIQTNSNTDFPEYHLDPFIEYYLECPNGIDCPGWPSTSPYQSIAIAIAEWNDIQAQPL
jgi:hypothetical protein